MADEFVICHHMGGKSRTRGVDGVIATLAGQQHGVVSRRQLLAAGVSGRAVERRIEGGRLHPLRAGVYAVGHRVVSREGRWMAAVLAAGGDAVLSHRSAAALWGIRPTASARVEITAPRTLRPRKDLLPHCAVLPADEMTTYQRHPGDDRAQDPPRPRRRPETERARPGAERSGDPQAPGPTGAMLDAIRGGRGTATLRTLLFNARRSLRSPTEAEFLAFIRAHGLPEPETNVIIEDYECDAVWRDARLIVELDGFATHGTRRAFEQDRARDRKLAARGWRTLRVTKRQLDDPGELRAELLSSLRA